MKLEKKSNVAKILWELVTKDNYCSYRIDAIKEMYDAFLEKDDLPERKIVTHTKRINDDELFGNIDSVISMFQKLKEEGYTNFIWNEEYSEILYSVSKKELEYDNEYAFRLRRILDDMIRVRDFEITKKENENKEIEELKAEMEELKKKLHIYELQEELNTLKKS